MCVSAHEVAHASRYCQVFIHASIQIHLFTPCHVSFVSHPLFVSPRVSQGYTASLRTSLLGARGSKYPSIAVSGSEPVRDIRPDSSAIRGP